MTTGTEQALKGKGRLDRQNTQKQQGRAIHVDHSPTRPTASHRGVYDVPGKLREAEAEQARQEQHRQSGSKASTIRAEIAEQFQCLSERFPVELHLGRFDPCLIIT